MPDGVCAKCITERLFYKYVHILKRHWLNANQTDRSYASAGVGSCLMTNMAKHDDSRVCFGDATF